MMDRRGILRALLGAPALVSQIPTMARGALASNIGTLGNSMGVSHGGTQICSEPNYPARIISRIYRRREDSTSVTTNYLPHHIATKRSWSNAFKAHVLSEERQAQRDLETALERDQALAKKIAEVLGIG